MTAKPSIYDLLDALCKFGVRAAKVTCLTPGDLLCAYAVRPALNVGQPALIAKERSAEGIVGGGTPEGRNDE